jgi:AcrR family transcriptional regulator
VIDERPIGLRERKKLETHRALARAAVRLAGERGLEGVTVEDIAAGAGVSPRTFFNYFASKEDAVLLPDPDQLTRARRAIERLAEVPAGVSTVRALGEAFLQDARQMDEERDEWLTRMRIIEQDPSLIARLFTAQTEGTRLIVEAVAHRTGLDPVTDLFPVLVVHALGACAHAASERWYQLGGAVPMAELYTQAVEMIAGGFPEPVTAGSVK